MVLIVRNHLVEVLGQLGGELVVPKAAALLVEDVGDGGDQQQLLLGVGLGEAVDAEGVQHHRGTSGLLVSQVPGNWRVFFSLSLYVSLTWQRRGGKPGGRQWPPCQGSWRGLPQPD